MWGPTDARFSTCCLACGTEGAASLGVTRRGWPFLSCSLCRARMFLNSPSSLNVLRRTDPDVVSRLESAFRASRSSQGDQAATVDGALLRGGAV